MLIRHAESEHNEAERNWDLKGLLLKRDHGITTAGYAQCDALQAYVAEQRADAASPWADARLELYASPLTRAVQTALIATNGWTNRSCCCPTRANWAPGRSPGATR